MTDNIEENYFFVSTLEDVKDRPGIPTVEGGLSVRPLFPKQLKSDEVKKSLSEAAQGFAEYLDKLAKQENEGLTFTLEEAEVTMQVSQSGKVNIYVADVGGAIQGGIKFKWKRKTHTSE